MNPLLITLILMAVGASIFLIGYLVTFRTAWGRSLDAASLTGTAVVTAGVAAGAMSVLLAVLV